MISYTLATCALTCFQFVKKWQDAFVWGNTAIFGSLTLIYIIIYIQLLGQIKAAYDFGIDLLLEKKKLRTQFIVFQISFTSRVIFLVAITLFEEENGYNLWFNYVSILMYLVWNTTPVMVMLHTHQETYSTSMERRMNSARETNVIKNSTDMLGNS